MRMHIVVTDDHGNRYEGTADLVAAAAGAPARRPASRAPAERRPPPPVVNFDLPLRAVMNAHARRLSGPQKFTLLLAALTKGKTGTPIEAKELQRQWNKMKEPMGGVYNGAYSTRAKANGWVDTPKHGAYTLLPHWKEAVGDAARARS